MISHRLVAISSAAILAIYGAGFVRTREAAARLAGAEPVRRPPPAPADLRDRLPAAGDAAAATGTHVGEPVASAAPAAAPVAGPHAGASDNRPPGAGYRATPSVATGSVPHMPESARPAPSASVDDTRTSRDMVPAPVSAPAAPGSSVPPQPGEPDATAPDDRPTDEPAILAGIYRDGAYTGWGTSRHGDIQASVTVEHGRIAAATIAQCLTRYPCSWIAQLPGQVVTRQSPEVDLVTGATESANAFYTAVVEALAKAR